MRHNIQGLTWQCSEHHFGWRDAGCRARGRVKRELNMRQKRAPLVFGQRALAQQAAQCLF